MLHLAMLLVQAAPAAIPSPPPQQPIGADASGAAAPVWPPVPCRIRDLKGRLVDFKPTFCESLANFFKPRAPAAGAPYTLLQLGVDPTGKVDQCSVVESSGVPRLDVRACAIAIDKARYTSTSAKGSPRRQSVRLRISWPASLATMIATPVPASPADAANGAAASPVARPVAGPVAQPMAEPVVQSRPLPAPERRLPAIAQRSASAATPNGPSYAEKLAAQRGIRGRNVEQGWTISD